MATTGSSRSSTTASGRPPTSHTNVFDPPWLNGRDLRGLSLLKRKTLLRRIVPDRASLVLYADHIEPAGVQLFAAVCEMDVEGIVAKWKAVPERRRNDQLDQDHEFALPACGRSAFFGGAALRGHADSMGYEGHSADPRLPPQAARGCWFLPAAG